MLNWIYILKGGYLRKLQFAIMLFAGILSIGIFGYHFIEGLSFFDSFYMTVITISTVGFMEVKPLSTYGRLLTIVIITFGIILAAYTIGTLLRMFIEGELRKTYGRRRMDKQISKLRDHYIICGYGRIGSRICRELSTYNKKFVVIDNDPDVIRKIEKDGYLYLPHDASSDDTLIKAGIKYAKGIVPAVRSDPDNVFITLTAKGLRSDIFVLARSSNEQNEMKLMRAGATRVVSPYFIGGKRMAQLLLKPTVVDFVDITVMGGDIGLQMEEAIVRPGSHLIGKNLIESNLRRDFGVIIVMIKKNSGELIFNPRPNEILEMNDVIVMLGQDEDMKRIGELNF